MKTEISPKVNRHRAGLMKKIEDSNLRGAALILEIIIYLVIVALIAVAVTSGVQAIRDLVFTSHAKGDIQNVQTWVEGKYTQDNKYPGNAAGELISYVPAVTTPPAPSSGYIDGPTLTTASGETNIAKVASSTGSAASYCILVTSKSISEASKSKFWLASTNPSKIYQSGTATNNNLDTPPTTATTKATAVCPAS